MKQRGKNAAMHLDDNSRFDTMHSVLEKQRQMKKNTVNAQEYTDNMRSAYKAYTSSTQKIRENLAKATEGLAAIDEKGMSDKIIEAIEKVSEIRNKQIAAASEYSTQMASFDSTRTGYIKNNGDSRDRFVVDKFEEMVRQRNAKLREEIDDLDRQYREIETNLYRDDSGKHHDPTDEEILDAKRTQDKILEQKQQLMDEYATFLQKTAVERDEILNGWQDKEKEQSAKKSVPEASEETKAKEEKIISAFDTAEKSAHPRWEKFKSLPVIAQLTAGGVAIGKKIAPKFETMKSDLLAGYAVMKERKQVRKAERALSDLDKLQGKEGSNSHLSRFKDSLLQGSGVVTEVSERTSVEEKSETAVPETASTEQEVSVAVPFSDSSDTASEPVNIQPEDLHTARLRKAGNRAVLQALDDTGLRRMINDYYWTDISKTHDIVDELSSSENVMTDVTKYVDHIKGMINHCPNETYRKAMINKLDTAMMETYAAKTESEKKVSAAEARIRDSEEFLSNLDNSGSADISGPEVLTV